MSVCVCVCVLAAGKSNKQVGDTCTTTDITKLCNTQGEKSTRTQGNR